MKRILSIVLVAILCLTLVACGDNSTSSSTASKATSSKKATEEKMSSETSSVDTRYRATREAKPAGFKYKNVNILTLGDSITAGDGTPSGYRYQLYKQLYQAGATFSLVGHYKSDGDVRLPERYQGHGGVGGRKIQDITNSVDSLCAFDYDIVLIMIGTNDSGNLSGAVDRYRTMLEAIIAKNPKASIYVGETIPKSGEGKTSTIYLELVSKLPDLCKEFAEKGTKITFVDMKYGQWKPDCYNGTVHPNEKGNALLAGCFVDAILDEVLQINDTGDENYVEPVRVSGIEISDTSADLIVGKAKTLSASVTPKNAEAFTVLWSSSDEKVATVSEYGKVVGVSEGKAKITATSIDGNFTKVCEVTVSKSNEPKTTSVFKNEFTANEWVGNKERITNAGFQNNWGTSSGNFKVTTAKEYDAGKNFKLLFNYKVTGNSNSVKPGEPRKTFSSISYNGIELRMYNCCLYIDLYVDGVCVGSYDNGATFEGKATYTIKCLNGKISVEFGGEEIITKDINIAGGSKQITATIGDQYRVGTFYNVDLEKY